MFGSHPTLQGTVKKLPFKNFYVYFEGSSQQKNPYSIMPGELSIGNKKFYESQKKLSIFPSSCVLLRFRNILGLTPFACPSLQRPHSYENILYNLQKPFYLSL